MAAYNYTNTKLGVSTVGQESQIADAARPQRVQPGGDPFDPDHQKQPDGYDDVRLRSTGGSVRGGVECMLKSKERNLA